MLNTGLALWRMLIGTGEDNGTDLQAIFKYWEAKQQNVRNILLVIVGVLFCSTFLFWSHAWIVPCGILAVALTGYLLEWALQEESYEYGGKAVLITGCDTGFGNLLARHLAQNGVTVFAGCLNILSEGAQALTNANLPRLHVLQMDVTSAIQVQQCVEYVRKATDGKGLWGLVNNAGLNFLGDIDLTTVSQFQRVTDINAIGVVRVTKAFLPLIKLQKGRILNVASIKGRLSMPLNAAYCMSKYAVEAFSDILRMEGRKFGINVSIIEPGNFGGATGCLNMKRLRGDFDEMWKEMSAETKETYGLGYLEQHVRRCESAIPTACFDLMRVVRGMEHALLSGKPKSRYLIAGSSGRVDLCTWRVRLNQILPTWLMDRWLLRDISSFKLAQQ